MDRRRLHRDCRHGAGEPVLARDRGRHLPAAADDPDGRHAARHRAVGGSDAHRRVVARLFLRRQPRGCGDRVPARRLLSAAALRHGDGDVRRCCAQCGGGAPGLRHRARDAVRLLGGRRPDDCGGAGVAAHLRCHCPVGHDRAWRRGRVDAHPVAAVRCDRLHVFLDSGGVPRRPRPRQHHRLGTGAPRGAPTRRVRLVPAPAVRDARVGGVRHRHVRFRTGRSIPRSRPVQCSCSSST